MLSLFLITIILTLVSADNWSTYPSISKTASINGFADPIYSNLPDCAKECVKFDTDNTPCPYWDTGCFCVMPQWSGEVADCFASKCSGSDVVSATSLAISLCNSAGAKTWMIPASASTQILLAKGTANAAITADITSSSSASTIPSTIPSTITNTYEASSTISSALSHNSSTISSAVLASASDSTSTNSKPTENNGASSGFTSTPCVLGYLLLIFISYLC
ncbi:hypothetical protein DASC09_008700 [Saccharomycopsis crataegensis]|uniref:CFEM domain-containing protein n=1 Tax=Saccharomycopsis crataegensis TaxID=43959 RepID=A0AAV5QGM4_9ASCO|nr:hypothetical protein DASC09_008700 [Saccharomycopsis crataegensis]